ncbi:hypothetical protein [Streptomyces sp. NPDC004008]
MELRGPAKEAQSEPEAVTTVRSVQCQRDAWSVTVAVQYADGSVRYQAVPVRRGSAEHIVAVTGAPAAVAGPGRGTDVVVRRDRSPR